MHLNKFTKDRFYHGVSLNSLNCFQLSVASLFFWMLFCHVVITVCARTFVTCTSIKINQSVSISQWIRVVFFPNEPTVNAVQSLVTKARTYRCVKCDFWPENFDPWRSAFRVTQGHLKRHGSIGYQPTSDFLLVILSNHGPILYRFRDERRKVRFFPIRGI